MQQMPAGHFRFTLGLKQCTPNPPAWHVPESQPLTSHMWHHVPRHSSSHLLVYVIGTMSLVHPRDSGFDHWSRWIGFLKAQCIAMEPGRRSAAQRWRMGRRAAWCIIIMWSSRLVPSLLCRLIQWEQEIASQWVGGWACWTASSAKCCLVGQLFCDDSFSLSFFLS